MVYSILITSDTCSLSIYQSERKGAVAVAISVHYRVSLAKKVLWAAELVVYSVTWSVSKVERELGGAWQFWNPNKRKIPICQVFSIPKGPAFTISYINSLYRCLIQELS